MSKIEIESCSTDIYELWKNNKAIATEELIRSVTIYRFLRQCVDNDGG